MGQGYLHCLSVYITQKPISALGSSSCHYQTAQDSEDTSDSDDAGDGEPGGDEGDDGDDEEEALAKQAVTYETVTKLLHDPRLPAHIQKLDALLARAADPSVPPLTRDQEYPTIVASNDLVVEIDRDINRLHRFIRDLYAAKFPELESLIANPVDYVKVVQRVGNATDLTSVSLDGLVPAHTVMVIKITATTTLGKPVSEETLKQVNDACRAVLTLEEFKRKLYYYILSMLLQLNMLLFCHAC